MRRYDAVGWMQLPEVQDKVLLGAGLFCHRMRRNAAIGNSSLAQSPIQRAESRAVGHYWR